jgi:ATP-binding cassette, subfamily C, bacterial
MYGNPSFIVLDEPNASLDAAGEEALMQAVQELKRLGTTIMIVTHKVNILTAVDTVLVMNSGTVQAYGPREEILGRVAGPRVVPTPAPAVDGAPVGRLGMEAQRAAG